MKKKWKRPELTVLMRGKPEEWVLGNCKVQNDTSGPAAASTGCMNVRGHSACRGCSKS